MNIDQIVFFYKNKLTDRIYAASTDSEPTARTFENDSNMELVETVNAVEYILCGYKTGDNRDTLRIDWLADKNKLIGNVQQANSDMIEILTAFVELADSGLSETSRIRYQTQRARDLLKLY